MWWEFFNLCRREQSLGRECFFRTCGLYFMSQSLSEERGVDLYSKMQFSVRVIYFRSIREVFAKYFRIVQEVFRKLFQNYLGGEFCVLGEVFGRQFFVEGMSHRSGRGCQCLFYRREVGGVMFMSCWVMSVGGMVLYNIGIKVGMLMLCFIECIFWSCTQVFDGEVLG